MAGSGLTLRYQIASGYEHAHNSWSFNQRWSTTHAVAPRLHVAWCTVSWDLHPRLSHAVALQLNSSRLFPYEYLALDSIHTEY